MTRVPEARAVGLPARIQGPPNPAPQVVLRKDFHVELPDATGVTQVASAFFPPVPTPSGP